MTIGMQQVKKRLKKFVIFFLRQMAKIQLKKHNARIIGVTGSVGKTTCVKAINIILSSRYKVMRTPKSFNSEIGVPLSILNQKSGYTSPLLWLRIFIGAFLHLLLNWQKYDYLILEMGVDKPGDMQYLLTFIHPQIGVFLNAAAVHTEQFANFPDPVAEIRREKLKLIETLPADGTGITPDDFEVSEVVSSPEKGLIFTLNYQGQSEVLHLPNILGSAYAQTFAAAAAVSAACQINLQESAKILKDFQLPASRMNLLPGIKNTILIDSTYNASCLSMLLALSVLNSFEGRRKIAVLGDMRELGNLTQKEHEIVAREAIKVADELVLVGPLMQKFFLPQALKNGFTKEKIHVFDSSIAAGEFIRDKTLQKGDVVLLKGSQNTIFLEEAVKLLMKNPADVPKLLCRQEPEWLKIKNKFFTQQDS